jgi:hypothetical protein
MVVGPSGWLKRPRLGGVLTAYKRCIPAPDRHAKTIADSFFLDGIATHPHDFHFRCDGFPQHTLGTQNRLRLGQTSVLLFMLKFLLRLCGAVCSRVVWPGNIPQNHVHVPVDLHGMLFLAEMIADHRRQASTLAYFLELPPHFTAPHL